MAITPSSTLYLMKTPFEPDYRHVVKWSSISQQVSTIRGYKIHEFIDYTFQRHNNVIRVGAHIDSIIDCNYVMYKNKEITDRWYYAFITKMEYVNDRVTHVYIKTDVYNTWWNDVTVKPSFIEREHTADDTVGSNTVPEQLETGPYKVEDSNEATTLSTGVPMIVIAATCKPDGTEFGGAMYGGIYSGVRYFQYTTEADATAALKQFDANGKGDAVQAVFMVPSMLYTSGSGQTQASWDVALSFDRNTVGGYRPKNKKLLTYPYKYLVANNHQGGSNVYHYEKFDGSDIVFRFNGVITPGCSIRCFPLSYNRLAANFDEGVNVGKFPICNWKTDVYTNWLTQNSVNLKAEYLGAIAGGVMNTLTGATSGAIGGGTFGPGGAVAGGVIGGVKGAVNTFANIYAIDGQVYQHQMVPDASKGNLNGGDVTFACKYTDIGFYSMSIKNEYARIIDDFFTMYGYKVCRVKAPNENHRSAFWFVKTVGVNLDGNCPAEDLQEFKNIYDNGVTFWKDPATIGDYTLDNSVV